MNCDVGEVRKWLEIEQRSGACDVGEAKEGLENEL